MAVFRKQKAATQDADAPVQFTKKDAQRIINVVHHYETGRRDRNPSTLPRAPGGGGGGVFAVAKFTGSWSKDTMKVVTFLANTSETTIVSNIFSNVSAPASGASHRKCGIAMDGTAWYLIAAEC